MKNYTGEHALSVDVMRSRTPTHLMWIVRHCQANEASRLEEKRTAEATLVKSGSPRIGSFLQSAKYHYNKTIMLLGQTAE